MSDTELTPGQKRIQKATEAKKKKREEKLKILEEPLQNIDDEEKWDDELVDNSPHPVENTVSEASPLREQTPTEEKKKILQEEKEKTQPEPEEIKLTNRKEKNRKNQKTYRERERQRIENLQKIAEEKASMDNMNSKEENIVKATQEITKQKPEKLVIESEQVNVKAPKNDHGLKPVGPTPKELGDFPPEDVKKNEVYYEKPVSREKYKEIKAIAKQLQYEKDVQTAVRSYLGQQNSTYTPQPAQPQNQNLQSPSPHFVNERKMIHSRAKKHWQDEHL